MFCFAASMAWASSIALEWVSAFSESSLRWMESCHNPHTNDRAGYQIHQIHSGWPVYEVLHQNQ